MTLPNHRRKPGFVESYFICRNIEGFYTNFNVIGQYNKKFSRPALANALKALVDKIPWLTYNFFPTKETPEDYHTDFELRPVDSIPFENVVEYRAITHFDETTLETINGFKNRIGCSDTPLWQLCVFETADTQYVCGYFCHSLADGGTALQFQRDLVQELSRTENETNMVDCLFSYEKACYSLPDILPARELMSDLFIPGVFGKVRLWMEMRCPSVAAWFRRCFSWFGRMFGAQKAAPMFSTVPVKKDLTCKFKMMNFPPREVEAITAYCRKNSITLTPFFTAVAVDCLEKIIFPHFPREDGSSTFSTSHYIAISGRRYFPKSTRPFLYGVFVCGAPLNFPPLNASSNEDLLDGMKTFHRLIQDEVDSRRSFKLMWMWSPADISKVLHSKIGQLQRYTTTVSNLGMVKDDPTCSWKLVNAWFSLNTSIGYHFILDMVSTEAGGLNLVLPYLPLYDVVEEVDGEQVLAMDRFKREFRKKCQELVQG